MRLTLIIIVGLLSIAACTMTITVDEDGTVNLITPTQEAATWTPEPEPQVTGTVETSGSNLNCRSQPNGSIVTTLPDGSEWIVIASAPGWYQVQALQPCWVSSAFFRIQ